MNISGSLTTLSSWSDYYAPEGLSDKSPGHDIAAVQTQTPSLTSQDRERLRVQRSKALVEKALQSSAIRDLYATACATPSIGGRLGPWQVQFASITQGAAYEFRYRKIIINTSCSDDDAIAFFVFGLTNVINSENFIALNEMVKNGHMSCEKYVQEIERIAFEKMFLHSEVMQKAIQEMGWNNTLDCFRDLHSKLRAEVEKYHGEVRKEELLEKMFERYWLRSKNLGTVKGYREQWERMACTNMPMDSCRAKTSARIARAVGRASLFS